MGWVESQFASSRICGTVIVSSSQGFSLPSRLTKYFGPCSCAGCALMRYLLGVPAQAGDSGDSARVASCSPVYERGLPQFVEEAPVGEGDEDDLAADLIAG